MPAVASSVAGSQEPDRVDAIVVPLDGSEFSTRALPVALRLASRPRLGARIHLLSAVVSEDEVGEREAVLAKIDFPHLRVEREVVVDRDPAGVIHQTVRRIGRATVCMASHGRGRSAALFGSVATEVVARGHDPVILVGQLFDDTKFGSGVVACIDETPSSAALLPVAVRWADLLHEKLTVITVAEPAPDPLRDTPVRRAFGPDGDVEAYLDAAVEPLRLAGHDVRTVPVFDPVSPADGICSFVEDHLASLVVVGSHARLGIERIAFGSVAAAVVHRSPSPVLVVPRPDASVHQKRTAR